MSHSYPSDISREQFVRILPVLESARRRTKPAPWTCLDFVHLRGVGEDVGELSVNCGWGFLAVGFQPSTLYKS